MKIEDILGLIDENNKVTVVDVDDPDTVIAWYDGKNSIPKVLNSCEIKKIRLDIELPAIEIQI